MILTSYTDRLTVRQTEEAIAPLKRLFEQNLALALNLSRVSAPLFVTTQSGLNDHLSGTERPVSFTAAALGQPCEVVQSLAKWKRMALHRYGFAPGEGLYTDMNAIRADEEKLDHLHSIYVDQWDWERVMAPGERNTDYLKQTVRDIYSALVSTQKNLCAQYPQLTAYLPDKIEFISSQALLEAYPELPPQEREHRAARQHGAIFVTGIGGALSDDTIHDVRAPDYDDWQLNGDLLVWYPVLEQAVELSSMGIRVDAAGLTRQLGICNQQDRLSFPFHQALVQGQLPQTIGGGIGQSRVSMLLLEKAHIGQVQVSLWPEETIRALGEAGIELL